MSHRVVQLSDTHFLEPESEAEGGFAYDTAAAFEAVVAHMDTETVDLVTVTGDIADHGRAAQYRRAADAFARIGAPVNACPGNHDQHAVFGAVARPNVATSRVIHLGEWCHLFVDSSNGVLRADSTGNLVDPDAYEDRLHTNGVLGAREAAWVREQASLTSADHLFIWLHHPPAPEFPLSADEAYAAEWRALIGDLPRLRGMAGGHTHNPSQYEFEGVPVFVAPSLKNNFDIEARTLLPPGYGVHNFADDGTVESRIELVDDPAWPRHPYGRAVHALLMGELDWDTFNEIVARKSAGS